MASERREVKSLIRGRFVLLRPGVAGVIHYEVAAACFVDGLDSEAVAIALDTVLDAIDGETLDASPDEIAERLAKDVKAKFISGELMICGCIVRQVLRK